MASEKKISFKAEAKDGEARAGTLSTGLGEIPTPLFMPVGTAGVVKNLTPAEVRKAGARLILANTYHLILRPGVEIIDGAGGVAAFMGWNGPVLTDSGGFQVFSLAKIRKVQEEGVLFNSHIDGTPVFLTPESVIQTQARLRSTIAMPLDICPPGGADEKTLQEAMDQTTRWLDRTISARDGQSPALFGIIQGGTNIALRLRHLEEIASRDVDGFAVGGLSVGEEKKKTMETIAAVAPAMPEDRPRYLMGMGKPADLLHGVAGGVDMFDCVFPTRSARHGLVFSFRGSYSITQSRWKEDKGPLDENCPCEACAVFDRRYLRHIYMSGETLAGRLLSLHNLTFYFSLMARARQAIVCYKFDQFMKKTLEDMEEYSGWDEKAHQH